jgi:hypothetical protein
MSRTTKPGKHGRRIAKVRCESPGIKEAHQKRHTYGHTEKILRRNRKLWTRLAAKRRRRLDKQAVET